MAIDTFKASETFIPRGAKLPAQFSEVGVEVSHHFVGDGYAKVFEVPAGLVIGQHKHKIGHDSHLILGRARVHVDGQFVEHTAPCVIHIEAHKAHMVEAVTPILWACVWPDVEGATTPEQIDHEVIEQ